MVLDERGLVKRLDSRQGLAQIVGSVISWGLAHSAGPLHIYQSIILTCGGISFVCLLPIFLLFPSRPSKARFLADDDKRIALERVRQNQTGTTCHTFKWAQVKECMRDPKWVAG